MRKSFSTLIALLSFSVAAYAIAAYAFLPLGTVLHPDIRASFALHGTAVVYLHVFGAAMALTLGPLQFWAPLRARWPGLDRWLGSTYLTLGVGVGGLSGLVLHSTRSAVCARARDLAYWPCCGWPQGSSPCAASSGTMSKGIVAGWCATSRLPSRQSCCGSICRPPSSAA